MFRNYSSVLPLGQIQLCTCWEEKIFTCSGQNSGLPLLQAVEMWKWPEVIVCSAHVHWGNRIISFNTRVTRSLNVTMWFESNSSNNS